MVAGKAGLINPKKGGEPGSLEKKWGVDIVLEVKDYDPCLALYGSGTVDAVCMTNMDALNPALGRSSTAIMPTSTSYGADKIIAIGWDDTLRFEDQLEMAPHVAKFLKGKKCYGLAKSVTEYSWVRGLERMGLDPKKFAFVNLEPAAAATAMQTGSNDVQVIGVWNPYALQTLRTQKKARVVFDSRLIREEIIDMVVVANASLEKKGGQDFACCVCDVFYEVSRRLASDKAWVSDATFKALGADFSNLGVEDMKLCCKETQFYSTPADGIKLFDDARFQNTMKIVVSTCQKIGVLDDGKSPTLGYNNKDTQLNFSTEYMKLVSSK